MNLLQSLVLGIIQGFTEFLPVSSSGHLAIFQNFFGEVDVGFDVILHLATLLTVIAFFHRDIFSIIKDFFTFKTKSENFKIAIYLIIASIPAGIIGLLLSGIIENIFSNTLNLALGFLISGLFLFIASYYYKQKQLDAKKSIIIGLSQALALIPGISRSGATVSTSLILGIEKRKAIKFSFLLSIPVIIGANLIKINSIISLPLSLTLIGFFSAFISGFFAIHLFLNKIKISNLKYFAYYCWILALILLLSQVL